MNEINADVLTEATITALERTAMVLAEPADADAIDEDQAPTVVARIHYRGATTGSLVLAANDAFLRDLASSLLGEEPESVDLAIHGADALKEMANILGGSIIVAMSGEACEYSLSLPEVVSNAELPASSDSAEVVRCAVDADEGTLRVYWTRSRSASAA